LYQFTGGDIGPLKLSNASIEQKIKDWFLQEDFKAPLLIIWGPNGSGKTTWLKKIVGIMPPHEALFPNYYVGHEYGFKEHLSLKNNLLFRLSLIGLKSLDFNLLDDFELRELLDQPVSHLSKGQKQRAALATAFSVMGVSDNKRILVADEPLAHLDEKFKAKVLHYLEYQNIRGILTAHSALKDVFSLSRAIELT
jgi:ABC-type multidrug transport system ATPase subunit